MNYQHLYAYLETRPIDELKECMDNVVKLAKKNKTSVDQTSESEDHIILNAGSVLQELKHLRVAQRIWTQEAISGKFGEFGLSECFSKPEVVSYLVHVNGIIEERMSTKQEDLHSATAKSFYVPISPHTSSIDTAEADAVKRHIQETSPTSTIDDSQSNTPYTAAGDSPIHGKRKREHGTTYWTPDMDSTLLQHVLASDDTEDVDWDAVAAAVGHGVRAKRCEVRWKNVVEPQQRGMKKSEAWTDAEVQKLFQLVSQHTTPPVWLKNQQRLSEERIDWVKVSQAMGRIITSCRSKWSTHRQRSMKGGPFTAAEDALIRQRVAEWGDKGQGLWVRLEKEMNRPSGAITNRWNALSARVV